MIPGNSGCGFIFDDISNIVIKYSNNYSKLRFEDQINKQILFPPIHQNITTPIIYSKFNTTDNLFVVMEYIRGFDFIEAINNNYNAKDIFILLSYLIDVFISQSSIQNIPQNLFIDKIQDTKNKLPIKISNQINVNIPNLSLLIGPCHGDLTLSNMIFKDNDIYLIDFLQTYLDSPLQDIIKIRQDTKHKWIKLKSPNRWNTKLDISLSQLDEMIVEKYSYIMNNDIYYILQYLNLIRILPYSTNVETTNFILKEINNISWEL